MFRFYLSGQLLGSYLIVIHLCAVSMFPISGRLLKFRINDYGYLRSSRFGSSKSCLVEGKGEMTQVTYLRFVGNCPSKEIDLKNNNSLYKGLIEKVTKGCNGRPSCRFSRSRTEIPRPLCRPALPFTYLHIGFVCKPKTIDNSTVLNMGFDLDIKMYPTEKSFLVLELQERDSRHRQCQVQGRGVNVSMLHVDFGPDSECDDVDSASQPACHRAVTLASSGSEEFNYTWIPSKTFRIIQTVGDNVDIDLYVSTGFVWLELSSDIAYKVQCYGSIRINDSTSSTPDPTLSTSTASTTTVDPGPTANINAEITESGTKDLLLKIVIFLAVGLVAALMAIFTLIMIVVFRQISRRKKRRIQDYDIPALTKQDLSPYDKPIIYFEEPDASKVTDYLEVQHCDYGDHETTGLFHQPDHAIIYEEIHG